MKAEVDGGGKKMAIPQKRKHLSPSYFPCKWKMNVFEQLLLHKNKVIYVAFDLKTEAIQTYSKEKAVLFL